MKSIMQEEKCCYVCGTTTWLEEHHVFEGIANRKLSEKYGLKIYLCHKHHNEVPDGIHFDKWLRDRIKQEAEKRFIEYYNSSIEEFIKIFGKNFLEVKV